MSAHSRDNVTQLAAPDVGTRVKYGDHTFRVDGWLRLVDKPVFGPDQWLDEILFDSARQETTGQRLMWCTRERATHLALAGVYGATVPVSECKVVGRVSWPQAHIDEQRAHAL